MSALRPDLVTNLGVCPAPELLRQHISGWLSESESEEIERHLSRCSACEAAALQFEPGHDTLMQSLQATVGQPGQNDVTTAVDGGSAAEHLPVDTEESPMPVAEKSVKSSPIEAPIEAAIDRARRLLDVPLQAESERSHRDWNPPQRELGVYELLKPLGRGGMGAVYLARHRQLGKQVAIKLLPVMSAEDSDVRTRFDREIRVVGRLNHPSIVAATDAGEIEGTQFLVMEYVPGLDLSRLARLMGRLPVADACELIRQASLGLSCAHAEGVVHRDIKPSNLMLDDQGRIRILDFGLAQWTVWDEASVDLTTVGQLMGTLDYMAPEQAEAVGSVDYRADLYALGATLFRLLCGRAPLAAAPNQSPLEKLRLLANHQPPKLSTLCPEAPEELVKLVTSLLSRRPSDRPASAAHVAEQLAPFAEGSNLVELLQQAKEKAATSPELLKKSAFPDHPPFLSSAPASLAPLPDSSGSGRSKIVRRLLLAASLPILIIAGILIKLETSKGQLVIESVVDNVSVKLLKDGKPVDGIQVSHGTTSTRLNADNYEITIDGPSDGLMIDNDKFTLKNGETVVARIQRVEREDPNARSVVRDGSASIGENGVQVITPGENTVELIERFTTILEHSKPILDFAGIDRELIDVQRIAGKPNQLRITALKPGACRVNLVDQDHTGLQVDVVIQGDVRHLEALIHKFHPDEDIQLEEIGNVAVRLFGIVSTEAVSLDVTDIAEQFYPTVMNQLRLQNDVSSSDAKHSESNSSQADDRALPLYEGQPLSDPVATMRQKLLELDVDLRMKEKTVGPDHPAVLALKEEIKIRAKQLDAAMRESDDVNRASHPLYNGQPLSHWLASLKTDRSPAKQRECLEAIRRLADVANSEEATTSLTEFLRADFGEERDAAVDQLGFQCIARLNPDQRFLAWWMKEFQTGDEAWQTQLAGLGSHLKFSSGDQLAEFERRLKTEKTQNKLSPQNVKHVADFIVRIGSTSECSRHVSDRLVQLLDDMTTDDRSWWLAVPHQVRFGKLSYPSEFMQLFAIRSCQIASDVIGNAESSSTQIAQAAMVFHSHRNHWPMDPSSAKPVGHLWELYSEPNKHRFLKAADGYLKRVLNEPARMTDFIRVPQEFDHEARYQHFSIASRYKIKFSHEMMQNGGGPDPAPDRSSNALIEVLDAIYFYDSGNGLRSGPPVFSLSQPASIYVPVEVADSVKALRSRLRSSLPQLQFQGPQAWVVLNWPQLSYAGSSWSVSPVAEIAEVWGDYTPTADDWLRLCLLGHEVLNAPIVGEESPDLSATAPNPSTPATQAETPPAMSTASATPAPLYEGKPLEHWLDMLSRERSVLGLKAAIEGCTALVAEDNAGVVTDALLKALPGLDGELKVTDKETNSVWTLDYAADGLLRKANPGSRYFEVWVKARSESTDRKWNERLLKLADQRAPESPDELASLIEWGRIVLSETSSSQDPGREKQAAIDAAVLLRNFSGINYFGTKQRFVDFVAPILTESPMLDDRWWISEPLVYREFKGELSEVWPAPIKAKITETAVRVLEKVDSDPSMVVQACIILANGAVLNEEQKATVMTAIQRRLEDTSKSPEALTAMVSVPESFVHLTGPSVGSIAEPGFVQLQVEVGRSLAADIPLADTSLVLQLLNVVSLIDKDKRCQPQVQKIFESSRDVFEIVNAQRLADLASRENTIGGQFGLRQRSSRLPLSLRWPALTTDVDASTPIHPGSPAGLQAMAFKTLWGEHVPSKQDWMKYLILLHPAMQDVVTAEIEKAGGTEAEK